MPTTYTTYLRLPKPDFNTSPWHTQLLATIDTIDATIYNALVTANTSVWDNDTAFVIGQITVDPDDATQWLCLVSHTSGASGTFSDARTAHPSYWTGVQLSLQTRGAWANDTIYRVNDLVYDTDLSIVALCQTAHTSKSAPNDIDDDAANWVYIVDGTTVNAASAVTYNNGGSGMTATNVQDALDEVVSDFATALALKSPLASPTFTGTPAAPTAPAATNTTQLATTQFVATAIANLRNGVAAGFDTLAEIATELALKATIASPTFTGTPAAPTATSGTATTQLATTAFVVAEIAVAASAFPSGTRMLFQQTSAPTAWTKETSSTINDSAVTFTTGSVGTGGSVTFSTLFARTATDSGTETGTVTVTPANNGATTSAEQFTSVAATPAPLQTVGTFTGSFSGVGHTHGIDMRVKYTKIIVAQKD